MEDGNGRRTKAFIIRMLVMPDIIMYAKSAGVFGNTINQRKMNVVGSIISRGKAVMRSIIVEKGTPNGTITDIDGCYSFFGVIQFNG